MAIFSEIMSAMNQANYGATPESLTAFKTPGYDFGFAGKSGPGRTYAVNKQLHATDIVEFKIGHQNGQTPADGMWTRSIGTTIAVRTADCLPVLFSDSKSSMVMAVHAGWKGLCAGILTRAVEVFAEQGIPATELRAAVGPAISRECYEVGPEVISAFLGSPINLAESVAALCVAKGKGDRFAAVATEETWLEGDTLRRKATASYLLDPTGVPSPVQMVMDDCTFTRR